ncbi:MULTISPECIES: RNA 2'-phosphotransferase [Dysgonomonas]|uniref:RNA 2'-phosphotransferase n=1 Tax=Dysgonomonas TaxID=156973 RepID=UPI0009274F0E|nr:MULTISPECIES: RNA 2'-phosphotransferase [Dysgonomonas]MBN9302931.1 RNA 2'-phosphotransferase [Dysgonomonas mossii]MBS5797579.1 RNA 2'-phosphotransferase [Dysgonomonas mossii]MBS7111458.1 RNA 2'-phosphotransferase [Dysgonomonas mossii]OJX65444.1 MAG: RNA--NAD 2'-phosphotransferase [Dysgonomonas sp. 37-18]HML64801.1 RNA 2'-phosphotransferase [Dysgonomonas sp.]
MTEQDKKRIGKFLSLVLRHDPDKIGLELDEQGWANVKDMIDKCKKYRYHFSMEDLIEIVETNDKQRYSFNEKRNKIRANQGHSINIDLALSPVEPPEFLYHGTATRFLSSIMEQGIIKGSRQHVHLSKDKETATKVGSRHGKVIVLTIMTGKMHKDGILFYQSDNGVWLTDYVDVKYISK